MTRNLIKINNASIFKFNNYKKILNYIRSKKIDFSTFDKNIINKRRKIFLRHDIDFNIHYLKKFLNFYEKLKIKANIFFMINANSYNLLERKNIKFINDISRRHCLGLHLDLSEYKVKDIPNLQNFFGQYLKISKVISFHRPKKSSLIKDVNKKKFINAYDSKFFQVENYISDSGQKINFHKKLFNILDNQTENFQLLIHPLWWQDITAKNKIVKKLYNDQNKSFEEYLKINLNGFVK